MAEKLQKTLSDPGGIASVGAPAGPDMSTANLINSITGVAKGAVGVATGIQLENRKEELRAGIAEVGEDISAVTSGKDLEKATARIKRFKAAREQGTLNDATLNIELEAELKRVIGTSPNLGQDLRRVAFEELGFDPTGSLTQTLLGKSGRSSPKRALTTPEKWMANAEALSSVTGIPTDTLFNLTAKEDILNKRASIAKNQASLKQTTGKDLRAARMEGGDISLMQVIADYTNDVQQGGIASPELAKAKVFSMKSKMFLKMSQDAADADIAFDSVAARAEVEAMFKGMDTFIDNGSFETIQESKVNQLGNASTIAAHDIFPELMLISKLGRDFTGAYVDTLDNVKDEKQLAFLKQAFPSFGRLVGNSESISRMSSGSFLRIMGRAPAGATLGGEGGAVEGQGSVPVEELTEDQSLWDDVISYMSVSSEKSPEVRDRVNDFLVNRNKPHKMLSMYAKKGTRGLLTPKEVIEVTAAYRQSDQILTPRTAAFLANSPHFSLENEAGKIVVKDSRKAPPSSAPTRSVPPSLRLDIERMNVMAKLVKNGYSKDVGEPALGFVDRKIAQINGLVREGAVGTPKEQSAAIKAFEENPNAETIEGIRAVNPALADNIQQRSVQGVQGVE